MRRRSARPAVIVVFTVLGGAFALLRAQQPAPVSGVGPARPPDLILVNGKIVTVDERFTIAQAVAIRDDRVIAVGTNQEITRLVAPGIPQIDLRGRTVIPGFIDDYMHLLLEAFGIRANAPDPEDFIKGSIVRDAAGRPTGLIKGDIAATRPVAARLPRAAPADLEASTRALIGASSTTRAQSRRDVERTK